MSKQFVKGNVYVFTKKKFVETIGKKRYKESKEWVDRLNGNEIISDSNFSGNVRGMDIVSKWCKCINPKI